MITLILPLNLDALQLALRQYLARRVVEIEAIAPERPAGGASGRRVYRFRVAYRGERSADGPLDLVLKRSAGRVDIFVAWSDRREAAFYHNPRYTLIPRNPQVM